MCVSLALLGRTLKLGLYSTIIAVLIGAPFVFLLARERALSGYLRSRTVRDDLKERVVIAGSDEAADAFLSNLDPEIREALLSAMPEQELPRNTYHGDGTPISDAMLASIRDTYARNTIRFQWERNDLLLLDNMLFSHGREAFSGNRQILVGMARVHGNQGSTEHEA